MNESTTKSNVTTGTFLDSPGDVDISGAANQLVGDRGTIKSTVNYQTTINQTINQTTNPGHEVPSAPVQCRTKPSEELPGTSQELVSETLPGPISGLIFNGDGTKVNMSNFTVNVNVMSGVPSTSFQHETKSSHEEVPEASQDMVRETLPVPSVRRKYRHKLEELPETSQHAVNKSFPAPSRQHETKPSPEEVPQTLQDVTNATVSGGNMIQRHFRVQRFKKAVNKSSYNKSLGGVTDNYSKQKLCEPTSEVYSRMRNLADFFHGELAPDEQSTSDYKKERIFNPHTGSIAESEQISPGELIRLIRSTDEGKRVIAILGMAGSGKSTLIKRLVRDVIKSTRGFSKIFKSKRFQLVHFLHIKDIAAKTGLVSAQELLFPLATLPKLEPSDIHFGYKWAINHENEILFALDGLDQRTWDIPANFPKINYTEKASVDIVMANFLSGQLFKKAKILLTSREHSVASLNVDLRPKTIIGLIGLELEKVQKVFDELVSHVSKDESEVLQSLPPGILPLCSIPLFLVYCAIIFIFNHGIHENTMSAVLHEILKIFLRSPHTGKFLAKEELTHFIKCFMTLSFQAILEGRVTFDWQELEELGLNQQMISLFLIKVPSPSPLNQNLFEDEFKVFFSHQTLQELLAAMHICIKQIEDFRSFVTSRLLQPDLSVVRRFVCGLLSPQGIKSNIVEIKDRQKKWDIFKQTLHQQAENEALKSEERPELLALLFESQDKDLIQSLVTKIDFSNVIFTPATAHALATILTCCRHLGLFRLTDCQFDEECLDILERVTCDVQLKVDKIELKGLGSLLKIRCFAELLKSSAFVVNFEQELASITFQWQSSSTSMSPAEIRWSYSNLMELQGLLEYFQPKLVIVIFSVGCDIPSSWQLNDTCVMVFRALSDGLCEIVPWSSFSSRTIIPDGYHEKIVSTLKRRIKMSKIMCVEKNEERRNDGHFISVGLAAHCGVEEVWMRYCGLQKSDMNDFMTGAYGAKIKHLDVSENEELGHRNGFKDVGSTVAQCAIEHVTMQRCHMEGSHMKDFANGAGRTKIKHLDVSWNSALREDNGFKDVGSTVAQCAVENVAMRYCWMEGSHMKDFANGAGRTKIKHLDVSWNEELGEDNGFKDVGSTVAQCAVENVTMQWCCMKGSHMKDFANGAGRTKIKVLDIRRNKVNRDPIFGPGLGEEGLNEITRIVHQNKVEELVMEYCDFKPKQLERFKKSIPGLAFRY